MDNKINLEAENAKLRKAIYEISVHMEEIKKILDGLKEITIETEEKHVTDENVKKLLEKYSSL